MRSFELLKGFRKGPKGLSSDVVALEWCPSMDLLALATEDRQLVVYRAEGWQKLFGNALDEPITCLTWRPDGQLVAVGHSDGTTALFNVENGEPLVTHAVHGAAIRLFHWLPATPVESASPYACELASLFPPLPDCFLELPSLHDAALFFGIASFSFGLHLNLLPVQESMRQPSRAAEAVHYTCVVIGAFYILVGFGLAALFYQADGGVEQLILLNLPQSSALATAVQCASALVALLSYPMPLMPLVQLLPDLTPGLDLF